MKKLNFFLIIFRLSCLGIFFYQAWYLFEDYSKKRTLADIGFTSPDEYPLPSICITTSIYSTNLFFYDSFNNTLNITFDEYARGKWKVNDLSERELWDFFSPKLSDLIQEIVIYKKLEKGGEKYSVVKISVENLPGFGVDIERKDYYVYPRIFCLSLRNIKLLKLD